VAGWGLRVKVTMLKTEVISAGAAALAASGQSERKETLAM